MDMITYARAKKYADKAVATGGNTELIESMVTEEVTKVVAGADADFDTLKEVADWIKNDKTGAAKMQVDIGTLKTDLEHIELTPGPQGPKGDKGDTGATGKDGAQGPKGADGKTAYKYAQDGGYTGTEEEFASDLHEAMNPAQADWEQNDENAIDYIKNKPFGETGEFEEVELFNQNVAFRAAGANGEILAAQVMSGCPTIASGITYKIIIGTYEYIGQSDSGELGNESLLFGPPIKEGEPFYCLSSSGVGIFSLDSSFFTETNLNIAIYQMKPIINSLPRKFIEEYSAGYKADIQNYEYDGQIYNSNFGAEIFNDTSNKAIGEYSHAEGNQTITIGDSAHAEGGFTKAIGSCAHAEGYSAQAIGNYSHAEGMMTKALGAGSHTEGSYTEATCNNCHAEGWYTIANTPFLHVQGAFNIPEENPTLFLWGRWNAGNQSYDGEKIVYIYNQRPSLNQTTGIITTSDAVEKTIKELKVGDYFSFTNNANSTIDNYLYAAEFVGSEVNSETNNTSYTWIFYRYEASPRNTQPGKYLHIVGNGDVNKRSNAHTIESDGTAWYQGDIYVGSTSGVNRDEGSKKLLTSDDLMQPDWEQNDEASLDFIKNKPFYDTGEFKWVDLVINPSMSAAVFGNCYILNPGASLSLDKEYKVVIDNKEYICSPRYVEYPDGFSGIAIGAEITGGLFLEPSTFKDTSIPFHIVNSSGNSLNAAFPNNQVPTNLQIYVKQADMKLLDRKFIDYIPGERVTGKEVIYDNAQTICGNGAEVFNNLESNMAIGNYSHAEGSTTIARGEGAHVEGIENIADGNGAHAEGCGTKAISGFAHSEGYMTSATHQGTHAEGTFTTASGIWSHAEGGYAEAKGKYSHVEGYNTVAATIHSHVQGMYNEIDAEQGNKPIYDKSYLAGEGINSATFNLNEIIYIITNPSLDCQTGLFNTDSFTEIEAKDLKINDIFVLNNTNDFKKYYVVTSLENDGEKINIKQDVCSSSTTVSLGKYAHIVGNGFSNKTRSNAHTLDWEGNAWYAGSVECTSFILKSSTEGSNKRFRVTIDDNGELHTEEIVE